MEVQLVSPEEVLYVGEADMVVARTLGGGEIAFLKGHTPFLGALADSTVRLILTGGGHERFAVHGGFVEVANDRVIVLSDVAELAGSIDADRARDAKARAEAALARDPDDEEAQAALSRAEVRLEVAGTA